MAAAHEIALDWWDSMFAAGTGGDPPTERAFVLASGMNALYDSFLADGLAPAASFGSVRATIRAPFEDPEALVDFLRFRFGVDPEKEVLDADHSFVHVTRCYFNDVMTRVGRLGLATIICEIDILFADELNKPQYGIQFERPTAMAMGGGQ